MRDPELVLLGMKRDAEGGFLTADVIATHQVEATLVLAEQVKRIADFLEGVGVLTTNKKTGAQLRGIGVTELHPE